MNMKVVKNKRGVEGIKLFEGITQKGVGIKHDGLFTPLPLPSPGPRRANSEPPPPRQGLNGGPLAWWPRAHPPHAPHAAAQDPRAALTPWQRLQPLGAESARTSFPSKSVRRFSHQPIAGHIFETFRCVRRPLFLSLVAPSQPVLLFVSFALLFLCPMRLAAAPRTG